MDFANPTAPHARIVAGAANGLFWRCVKPTVAKGIEIYTAATNQINLRLAGFEDTNFTAENCWIRGGSDGVSHLRAGGITAIKNSVISDASVWGVGNGVAGVTLENVVLARNNTSNTNFRGGCRKDVVGCTLSNVVAVGNGVSQFFGASTTSTVSYLASSDSSATGSNALTGVTTAAFTNYAGNIFTAAVGGVLDGTAAGGADRGLNLSSADIIAIASPVNWQMFARNKTTNIGNIPITGTYSGSTTPTSIEARWSGGSWSVIDATPTGGTFSGTLSGLTSGNGTLEVRYSNATTVTDSVDNVAIGAKLLFWGQSNFSGRATNPQTYTGTAGFFHKYTVTNNVWQQGADPFDTDTANGSLFPLLANQLVTELGCPVAFIGVAAGSTTLAQWQAGQTLNNRMLNYITAAASDGLEGICSWIGESDASNATTEADFKTRYNAVINQLEALTGVKSMLVAISGLSNADYANVRQWINDISLTNTNASGTVPQIWPLYQKIHYETNIETAAAANAIFDGVAASFYPSSVVESVVSYQISGFSFAVEAQSSTPSGVSLSANYLIGDFAVSAQASASAPASDISSTISFDISGFTFNVSAGQPGIAFIARNNIERQVTISATVLSTSTPVAYEESGALYIINNTGSAVSPKIIGDASGQFFVSGVGDVDLSGGYPCGTLADGAIMALKMESIRHWMRGNAFVTNAAGCTAFVIY